MCWREESRNGNPTKVPIDPATGTYASTADLETWTTYRDALGLASADDVDGLGFVFTEDDDLVGVDLDGCRDPTTGDVEDWTREIIDRLDSYTEISPSGTGYHVIARGTLPGDRTRRGAVEMYEAGRFFTVTGDHVPGTPRAVTQRADALADVYHEYLQVEHDGSDENVEPALPEGSAGTLLESDDAVLKRARSAANGDSFEQLWQGDVSGYDSHSEADMALCCYLAFWTGGDASQMDRLFRASGLMRPKWDEVHYADGSTYGAKTVQRARSLIDTAYPD